MSHLSDAVASFGFPQWLIDWSPLIGFVILVVAVDSHFRQQFRRS